AVADHKRQGDEDLIMAAKLGNVTDIQAALRSGASANARDTLAQGHLDLAAIWHRLMTPNDGEELGDTALQCAVRNSHPYQSVKALLDAGANLKTSDNGSGSLLFWAARGGDKETMLLLISEGANVNE